MGKIRRLPESLIRRIAAGEVVERPASVVKELIENALDAGAKKIVVTLEGGGKSLIRVADDGCGMSNEDAVLALERHTTSKIATEEDLYRIATMGFRGEALASIGAVSSLKLSTSDGSGTGVVVTMDNGAVVCTEPASVPRGTTVEVRGLFRHVPARLKYLKTDAIEQAHALRIVKMYAVAFPEVSFTVLKGAETLFFSAGRGWDLSLFRALYDGAVAHRLKFFEVETAVGKARGWITPPDYPSGRTSAIYAFVNGRPVKSQAITGWVREAGRFALPEGKVPFLVLFLKVPPEDVDVNVHPGKWEVRFRDADAVRALVINSVREGMMTEGKGLQQATPPRPAFTPRPAEPTLDLGTKTDSGPPQTSRPLSLSGPPRLAAPPFRVVGQVFDTFIAAEQGEEFLLLDQHIVSERVLFDGLKKGAEVPGESLLLPVSLELPAGAVEVLEELRPRLKRVGFDWVADGPQKIRLTAVPFYMRVETATASIREIVEDRLAQSGAALPQEEDYLNRLACKLAVKANTPLTVPEMERMVRLWQKTENPYTCPHGRPIFIRMSRSEMNRAVLRPSR
jgi:DNA mismatch repair protein MutL